MATRTQQLSTKSPLLLRPSEVAEALGIGRTTAYHLIASGQLPTVRIGTAVRVPADALAAWVKSRESVR